MEDLLHRRGRLRALRRVLEQDRVAGRQVRAGEARHLVVGVVPRHDPEEQADRAPADERRALALEQVDRLVGQQLHRVVGVVLVDRGAEVDLAEGLLDRLAHLARDDLRELLAALGVQLGDPGDDLRPLLDGRVAPPALPDVMGPADGGLQRVVADRVERLQRLPGRGVGHCVLDGAHARRVWSTNACRERCKTSKIRRSRATLRRSPTPRTMQAGSVARVMRRRPDQLTTGEWAVLGLVAEGPTHGFAVARALEPDGEVGRVWSMRRPLVYRTLDVLEGRELTLTAGTEASTAGPQRTLVDVTEEGRRRVAEWLVEPVEHVRDARSELLLKLLFLDRRGDGARRAARRPARALPRAGARAARRCSTPPTASRARSPSGGWRTPPPRCASSTRSATDRAVIDSSTWQRT